MFDIGSSELLLIVIVAVVVIGPKDLPRVLYKLGQIIGRGRAMTRHFRSGIDEMIRQAELEEMEKKWAADNARILSQTPTVPPAMPPAAPLMPMPETGGSAIEDAASHAAPATPTPTGGFDPTAMEGGSYEVGPDSASGRAQEEGEDAGRTPRPARPSDNGPAA